MSTSALHGDETCKIPLLIGAEEILLRFTAPNFTTNILTGCDISWTHKHTHTHIHTTKFVLKHFSSTRKRFRYRETKRENLERERGRLERNIGKLQTSLILWSAYIFSIVVYTNNHTGNMKNGPTYSDATHSGHSQTFMYSEHWTRKQM